MLFGKKNTFKRIARIFFFWIKKEIMNIFAAKLKINV